MKNRNFLSVAEKRKFEKFANDTAIHEARKLGGNEFAEAIEGLMEKGLVTCKRMESGEWHFYPTDEGRALIEIMEIKGETVNS